MRFDFAELVADEDHLRRALGDSDIVTLAMVLVQLSGDAGLLDDVAPFVRGPFDYSVSMPADQQDAIRDRLVAVLKDLAAKPPDLAPPSPDLLQRMMSTSVGEPVSDEYVPMMLEELAFHDADPKGVEWTAPPAPDVLDRFHVVVIGGGMSGLCAAIKLKKAGIPFTIIEKNDTVGGTWYENRYPGCGVDTPNHFYSFSFEPSHEWSEFYSKRDELHAYLEGCADKYDVRRHVRFNTTVEAVRYDETAAIWRLTLTDEGGHEQVLEANAVISAVGQLNRPAIPDIPGLGDFGGPAFHTGAWEPEHDLAGKRVALIGAGASAVQAGPAIAADVARLSVFQRTPHWIVHNPNYHRTVGAGKQWVLEHLPFYARWYRFQLFWGFSDGIHAALQKDPGWDMPERSLNATNERFRTYMVRHAEREVGDDADLLAKVIPPYPPYGKRMLIDNHWYAMLKRDNVDLVTDPIDHVTPDAIVTADGTSHEAEAIILATGFQAAEMLAPMDVVGRDGRVLRDEWGDEDPRAYLGMTMPGFPNFFVLYGPNTNLGHGGSIMFHAECQVRYIMKCLRHLIEGGHRAMECRAEVHDAFNDRLDAAHEKMVWTHPGMDNWYKNSKGRVITNSPWRLVDYWTWTETPQIDDFIIVDK